MAKPARLRAMDGKPSPGASSFVGHKTKEVFNLVTAPRPQILDKEKAPGAKATERLLLGL
jgi:hypothetical protein